MAEDVPTLFAAVREACFPATWARGLALAQADAVSEEAVAGADAAFRVSERGGMSTRRVCFYLDGLDWECECGSREPACQHVVAAAAAWHEAHRAGKERVAPRHAPARVGYRFTREPGGLALERTLERDGASAPLEASLAAIADGRAAGGRFVATRHDLAIDVALGVKRRGLLPQHVLGRVLTEVAHCADVTLDGEPIAVSAEAVLPRARLEDSAEGFWLVVEPDPAIGETFANGAVLRDGTLRPIGDPRLTAAERRRFERGCRFGPEAVAELVTEILPALATRIPLEIRSRRLPRTVRERPRVVVDARREGDRLVALATLVYGDPPLARVDAGRLVALGGEIPLRDEAAERACVRELERGLGLTPGIRAEYEDEEAVAFAARLAHWHGGVRGDGPRQFRVVAALEPHVAIGERFDVVFESVAAGGARQTADPEAVLRAWRAGHSLVALGGGGFAPLPRAWLDRHGHLVADLLAARDAAGRVPRCCWHDLSRLCEALDHPAPADLVGLRRLAVAFDRIPPAELPADLATELRGYQRHGVDWLSFMRDAGLGALLGDDMGLGKTLQALCVLRPPALVVAPTSVLHNWADEIRRHRPALRTALYHGPRRELDPTADVTLTSYTILRLDTEALAAVRWGTVVLDEAQNIKNPESQVAAAANRIPGEFRLALTGTPVENRLDELWSQFHFLNRGLLGGRSAFRDRYAEPIAAGDAAAARRLRERIRPFLLRRLKREVARELPPRTDMVLYCELDAAERELYDAVRAATMSDVVRELESGGGVMAALEALLRLRQAACHSGLLPGRVADGSSKLRVLLDALDSVVAEGHKALVFSQWTSLLDLTEPHLREAGLSWVRLDGTTRDRAEVVRRFQEERETSLMLVSLKAGGTGLNLTAADHVFLLDPWWNPAVEDQAADRAHRIGQERPVMVYRLVAEATVEERILELQRRKREIADAAIGGTTAVAALTRDDLLALLA